MKVKDVEVRIKEFVGLLPKTVSVVAYGSGVVHQDGEQKNDKKQIDLIVIVDKIKDFYKESLKQNKKMYPAIPKLYFRLASAKRLKKAAGICYTSGIKYGEDTFKVGVIEKSTVLSDLENWDTFYLAGRFHKERCIIEEDKDIEKANERNKDNATLVALILLNKENPTLLDLYEQICSLSYIGDSRKKFKAEDPNKVRNIVIGSKKFLDREYRDRLPLFTISKDEHITIKTKEALKAIPQLPERLKDKIDSRVHGNYEPENIEDIRTSIVEFLTEVNKKSSLGQTVKGVFTTGPREAVGYALRKLKKGRNKKQQ